MEPIIPSDQRPRSLRKPNPLDPFDGIYLPLMHDLSVEQIAQLLATKLGTKSEVDTAFSQDHNCYRVYIKDIAQYRKIIGFLSSHRKPIFTGFQDRSTDNNAMTMNCYIIKDEQSGDKYRIDVYFRYNKDTDYDNYFGFLLVRRRKELEEKYNVGKT